MWKAVAQWCSVNIRSKKLLNVGKHLCGSLFFNKVSHVYLHFKFYYKWSLIKWLAVQKKLGKVIAKHLWWSSLSLKLETVTLQRKIFSSEFWYRFLWDFTSILKAIAVLLLLDFDSYPVKAITTWLIKQMCTLSNQSFRVVLWIVWPKKVGTFQGKCQRW